MRVIVKSHIGELELAASLHINVLGGVDQNIGDGRVGQQRLERSESEHFVAYVPHQLAPLDLVDGDALLVDDHLDQARKFLLDLLARQALQLFQLDPIDDRLMDVLFQLLVGVSRHALFARALSSIPGRIRRREKLLP